MAVSNARSYAIPYRCNLTEKFEPGQTLTVKGRILEEAEAFSINFMKASAEFEGQDIAFHFNVRFDGSKNVVMNSFANGSWEKEETKRHSYKKGDQFDIRIRAHDDKFEVHSEQKDFAQFRYRQPLSSVRHLSIDGDIELTAVQWSGKYFPVPYESALGADGLRAGRSLSISGTPEKKGKGFAVNLLRRNGDIAFHFNVRMDSKTVVRNALQGGQWGNEEREGKTPFEKSVGFDLVIRNESYAFQVFVNGSRFCTFAHRGDPNDIYGLQVQGDLELTGIQIV